MQDITRKYTLAAFIIVTGFLTFLFLDNPSARNFLGIAGTFIKASVTDIESSGGRTNILIMGKAGKEHAGGDLTDTMILASLTLSKPGLTLISIPRDLWIPEIRAKVNSAYHYGGIPLAKESVGKVIGAPIQYGVVIDFSGFKDVVGVLGGIEVNVERSFTDREYPVPGRENDLCGGDKAFACRYETLNFEAGMQIMDGATALKFVRSRHAEGEEGTDTARAARQQKVVEAIKNKLLSPRIFLNPIKDIEIYKVVKNFVQTDISMTGGPVLARKILGSRKSIRQLLIPQDLLVSPPISSRYDNQYVFIPKLGNGRWTEINSWVAQTLK